MYYDTQRKLAFVMPPRTGTTMFSRLLTEWGVTAHQHKHCKPPEAQIDGLNEYVIYGFFRDPLDRYLSLVRYFQMSVEKPEIIKVAKEKFANVGLTIEQVVNASYDDFVDFPETNLAVPFYFDPQVDWLANAQLLDFNNYTQEVLRVARMLGQNQVQIGVLNDSPQSNEIPSQKVIDYVQLRYADDYRLGRERGLLA